jgi:hypothetical protein
MTFARAVTDDWRFFHRWMSQQNISSVPAFQAPEENP